MSLGNHATAQHDHGMAWHTTAQSVHVYTHSTEYPENAHPLTCKVAHVFFGHHAAVCKRLVGYGAC